MKKACKVVTTFFGERRTWPKNSRQTRKMFENMIESEKSIDAGVDCDIIIVNHQLDEIVMDVTTKKKLADKFEYGQVTELLDSVNGIKTKNGTIITMNRPWDKGTGFGFKSRNYVQEKYQDDYEYWFFIEDDLNFLKDNYFKKCIDILEKYPECAFVGTWCGISPNNHHCHGSIGCTHQRFLKEQFLFKGEIPYPHSSNYRDAQLEGEVVGTKSFLEMGYHLQRCSDNVHEDRFWTKRENDWFQREKTRLKNSYYDGVYTEEDKEGKIKYIFYENK